LFILTENENYNVDFQILDMRGQLLFSGKTSQNNDSINIQNLSVGMYLIQIQDSNGLNFSYKFLKN